LLDNVQSRRLFLFELYIVEVDGVAAIFLKLPISTNFSSGRRTASAQ